MIKFLRNYMITTMCYNEQFLWWTKFNHVEIFECWINAWLIWQNGILKWSMALHTCNHRSRECFFNLFHLENYVVTYLKFPDLFIIRIHIVAPTRTTTKSPSAISKPVANVKATVNSGGGDNGAKIAELTQQVWMQSKAICVDT